MGGVRYYMLSDFGGGGGFEGGFEGGFSDFFNMFLAGRARQQAGRPEEALIAAPCVAKTWKAKLSFLLKKLTGV
jgi:hypothetical protein